MPKFRDNTHLKIDSDQVEIRRGSTQCTFEIHSDERHAVSVLLENLLSGNLTEDELKEQSPEIAEKISSLLDELYDLRFLSESNQHLSTFVVSGVQLYREVLRMADRLINRSSKSRFYRALVEKSATRDQLIGYALEYWWIVNSAPAIIGSALAAANSFAEQTQLQDYLNSELGHDKFLAKALKSVGITDVQLAQHEPLPSSFSLSAALGVYARQHPLSFKACLFLFERAQPEFIAAFEKRCQELDLSAEFFGPLSLHADINEDYKHGDISRTLLEFNHAVDLESASVVKRHVFIMVETLIEQESEILDFYGRPSALIPRIFP